LTDGHRLAVSAANPNKPHHDANRPNGAPPLAWLGIAALTPTYELRSGQPIEL